MGADDDALLEIIAVAVVYFQPTEIVDVFPSWDVGLRAGDVDIGACGHGQRDGDTVTPIGYDVGETTRLYALVEGCLCHGLVEGEEYGWKCQYQAQGDAERFPVV